MWQIVDVTEERVSMRYRRRWPSVRLAMWMAERAYLKGHTTHRYRWRKED